MANDLIAESETVSNLLMDYGYGLLWQHQYVESPVRGKKGCLFHSLIRMDGDIQRPEFEFSLW
jgi:hypothetical protein